MTTLTTNIIAQTVSGDPDNCVMLGGHSDSVAAGPGINDDGSGSLSLIEVAKHLTEFSVNNCVRFAWWSGEEEGRKFFPCLFLFSFPSILYSPRAGDIELW